MEKHHCCKGAFPTEISLAKAEDVASARLDSLVIDRVITRKKAKELFKKFKEKLKEEFNQIDQSDIDELSDRIAEILLNLNNHIGDSTHITPDERTKWNNQFSGNYNDLTNKPNIPTVGNGTVSIKINNQIKGSFTTNQDTPKTIDLGEIQGNVDLGDYAKKSEIPDISGLAKKSEIPDISGLQPKLTAGNNITIVDNVISATGSGGEGGSVDLSNYYTKAEVETLISNITGVGTQEVYRYSNNADDMFSSKVIVEDTADDSVSTFTNVESADEVEIV